MKVYVWPSLETLKYRSLPSSPEPSQLNRKAYSVSSPSMVEGSTVMPLKVTSWFILSISSSLPSRSVTSSASAMKVSSSRISKLEMSASSTSPDHSLLKPVAVNFVPGTSFSASSSEQGTSYRKYAPS